MATTWILVANASEARLFESTKLSQGIDLTKEFAHPESRAKGSTLASDRPGAFQSQGAHGSFAEPSDPKQYEAERFAKELAKELEAGRTANRYERLILVASPHFYGVLKGHLNSHLSAMVTIHISKDYTKLAAKEVLEHIREHVRI
ncbi:MAG: host attachment protein [Gammaproteobacteria bacterium]|nr:host attachment protein [Gammaproteobacteria bacterium]